MKKLLRGTAIVMIMASLAPIFSKAQNANSLFFRQPTPGGELIETERSKNLMPPGKYDDTKKMEQAFVWDVSGKLAQTGFGGDLSQSALIDSWRFISGKVWTKFKYGEQQWLSVGINKDSIDCDLSVFVGGGIYANFKLYPTAVFLDHHAILGLRLAPDADTTALYIETTCSSRFYRSAGEVRKRYTYIDGEVTFDKLPLIYANIAQAEVYSNAWNFLGAKNEMDAAIQKQDVGWFHSYRAFYELVLGQFTESFADYDNVIMKNPGDFEYMSRGDAKFNLGLYKLAIPDIDSAIMRVPASASHYAMRAVANTRIGYQLSELESSGKASMANALYDSVGVKSESFDRPNPAKPPGCALYEVIAVGKGQDGHSGTRFEMAMADYAKAMQLDPLCGGYYASRADLKLAMRDYDGALADLNSAIRLEKEDWLIAKMYMLRAKIKYIVDDYRGAIAECNFAIFHKKRDNEMLSLSGQWGGAGQRDERFFWNTGRNYYMPMSDSKFSSHSQGKAASLADMYVFRGGISIKMDDYPGAIISFSEAISSGEGDPRIYSKRGDLYYETGQPKLAIEDYSKAIKAQGGRHVLPPQEKSDRLKRAKAYAWARKYDRAVADYDYILKFGGDKDVLAKRAQIKLQTGDYPGAASDFGQLGGYIDGNPDLLFQSGRAKLRSGDISGAKKAFKHARDLQPRLHTFQEEKRLMEAEARSKADSLEPAFE
ncbi:MAG: hypothetical protein WC861_05420 [Candidatus Micrarchaeia archaeon]